MVTHQNIIVKANLKNIINDSLIAITSSNEEDLEDIKYSFTLFLQYQNEELKQSIYNYIINNEDVKTNKKLEKFFKSFVY